jgi:hypothetical protein
MKTYSKIDIEKEGWFKIQDEEGFVFINTGKAYVALVEKDKDGNYSEPTIVNGNLAKNGMTFEVPNNHVLYARLITHLSRVSITPNY